MNVTNRKNVKAILFIASAMLSLISILFALYFFSEMASDAPNRHLQFRLLLGLLVSSALTTTFLCLAVGYNTKSKSSTKKTLDKKDEKTQDVPIKSNNIYVCKFNVSSGSLYHLNVNDLNNFMSTINKARCSNTFIVKVSTFDSAHDALFCCPISHGDTPEVPDLFDSPKLQVSETLYFTNPTIDYSGSVLNNEELIKVYNELDKLKNEAIALHALPAKLRYNDYIRTIVCPTPNSGKTPIYLTIESLEEINSRKWKWLGWENDPNNYYTFKSIGEFNMFYNNLYGNQYEVAELLEIKKYLEGIQKDFTDINEKAKKEFNLN